MPPSIQIHRFLEAVRRWFDILMLSVIGTYAFFLFSKFSWKPLDLVVRGDSYIPQCVGAAAYIVIGYIAATALLRGKWAHFRFAMSYPPLTVAVISALTLAAVIDLNGYAPSSDVPTRFGAMDYASCAGGFALILLAMSAFHISRNAIAHVGRDVQAGVDSRRSELPLVDSHDDRFNRGAVARRLAQLLNGQFGDDIGIAITGAFGSGKTTLVNFVENELRRLPGGKRVWLCRVSCWGFDDSRAALQHTLAAMLDCLERHVDCAAVRGLPAAYQQAFSAASTGWLSSILPVALVQDPNPTQQLRRLTPLLQAIDARLVVVIEDVDRQESSDFDPTHIERLLYSLKEVRGVSFMVCTSSQGEST